jgi:hypothetical protein
MERNDRRVHRHATRVDTCPDCKAGGPTGPATPSVPLGGDRGGKRIRILGVHPCPIWAYVFNEFTGHAGWVEVHQPTLVELLDKDLTRDLD